MLGLLAASLLAESFTTAQTPSALLVAPGIYRVARAAAVANHGPQLYFGTNEGHLYSLDLASEYSISGNRRHIGWLDRFFDHSFAIGRLAISPDGNWLAATEVTGDPFPRTLLFSSGTYISRILGSNSESGGIVFSEDSNFAYSVGPRLILTDEWREADDYLKWDLRDGTSETIEGDEAIALLQSNGEMALGRINSQYLEPSRESETIVLRGEIDSRTYGTVALKSPLGKLLSKLNYASWAGTRIAVRTDDRLNLEVYSLVDGKLEQRIPVRQGVWYQEFYMLGESLLLTNSEQGIQFWSVDGGSLLLTVHMYFDALKEWLLMFDPEGRYYTDPDFPMGIKLPGGALVEDHDAVSKALHRVVAGITEPRLHRSIAVIRDLLDPPLKPESGQLP